MKSFILATSVAVISFIVMLVMSNLHSDDSIICRLASVLLGFSSGYVVAGTLKSFVNYWAKNYWS